MQADNGPQIGANLERWPPGQHGASVNKGQTADVGQQRPGIRDPRPYEQKLIPSHGFLDERLAEDRQVRRTVVMEDMTPRCKHRFPPSLPCPVGKIDVLDVERIVERIEPPHREELPAIDR